MAPYRTVSQDEHAEAPRDAGIVGDVIAQFADPMAFYRELVQNAIDADSESVEVEVLYDNHVMLVRVRDRGCGMTRDILENQLLVLFRSTKEKDNTKIGKFGIGFASVLAPNPNVVVVQTSRDGRRLVLHLKRDLTYQIFDGGPATQTGTTVELELAMSVDDAKQFAQRSLEALVKWCRHATVPIEFRAEVPGMDAIAARVDRPLALDHAIVEVKGVSEDGQLTAIVGIAADAKPYAGFFNHGLTLYETTERLVGKLAFKIQDARLGHTLSRDNVRRDENFERALGMVRTLAEEQLPRVIENALRSAAERGGEDWERVAAAVVISELGLPPERWWFPLVDATPKGAYIAATSLGRRVYVGEQSTPLTSTLAKHGVPIVQMRERAQTLFTRLRELLGVELVAIRGVYTLVTPIDPTPADLVLAETMLAIFDACHRGPPKVILANVEGAHSDLLAVAGGPEDAAFPAIHSYVVAKDVLLSTPFTRTRRRAVVLNVKHPFVRMARAADDARMAAAHLARGVLLQHRILDVDKSRAIFDYTLTRIARGPA